MSKPNPFRARRIAGSASTTSPSSQGGSSSQLTSPFSGDFIASAFFEPGPEQSSRAASSSSLTPQQPPSSLASSDPSHRRQHKTVRIASPPVSAEGFAAGFGSGASTPTYTSPTLESVFPAYTPSTTATTSSAAVAAGHSLSNNTIEERLVQRDPSAPFQNLTPRPGSPPPEPIPDPFDTSEAAAVRRDANDGQFAAATAGERERYAASVFNSVASTMEKTTRMQQRPMSRLPAAAPSMTKRGQGERHTMGVDAFKRMLLTGDAGDSQEEQTQAYPQAQGQGQETKKTSGTMDVDEFKRLLLTGDTAPRSTTKTTATATTTTTTTQHNRQLSSNVLAPTVPLPRRSPSTRMKQAAGEDRGRRTSTPSTSTSTSTPGEKPPPPPPRARHGRTVSVKDQSTASTTTNALPTLDDPRRRSVGISRSASVGSSSSIPSMTGATTSTVPSPPLPRVSRLADTESTAIPASSSPSPSISMNPYHTSSPSLSRSSSILSSIGEPASGNLTTPSISEEPETPMSQQQQQGQRRPPTPPVTRRTSQYRRSVMGSKGVNALSPGTVSGTTTAAAAAGPRAPPPPPSPRPRARRTSGSSSIHDEEASRAGSSRSSSFSLTRNGMFEDLGLQHQAEVVSSSITTLPLPATLTASTAPPPEHQQRSSSTASSVASRRQSLPPPRPPPPRRRPGASTASEQHSQPQQQQHQQQREFDLPSRQRSLHAHRPSTSGGSSNRGPPPPPPPPPGRYDGASDWGRHIGRNGNVEGTMGDEKAWMAPSHAADVLADLNRLQQEIDAYRMKSAT